MKNFFITIVIFSLLVVACKDKPEVDYEADNNPENHELHISDSLQLNNTEHIHEESISFKQRRMDLKDRGFQVEHMVDPETQDTILMQQYFIAFLKSGPIRDQNEEESRRIQSEHMAHLSRMYELGFADISGPFGSEGDIRGITIYNVPNKEMADSLANADPAVKAQRLVVEIHPWWAMKEAKLR